VEKTVAAHHGCLTIDNLRSTDVVTVDGRTLVADHVDNPDLFWGLRGGGGNFAIVTSFEFDLHPVGPTVLAGMVLHCGCPQRCAQSMTWCFTAERPTA
jgi:FAD/FMN-containing dehydrogenase